MSHNTQEVLVLSKQCWIMVSAPFMSCWLMLTFVFLCHNERIAAETKKKEDKAQADKELNIKGGS